MPAKKPETLPEVLRATIQESGLSYAAIARTAEVDPRQVGRFVEGYDLTFEAAGRICQALGLELKAPVRPKGRPSKGPVKPRSDG